MSPNTALLHAGFWVGPDELESVIHFFSVTLGFGVVSRAARRSGGERVILKNAAADYLEVLTSDDIGHLDDYPQHPRDRVAGVPHLCFRVDDLDRARDSVERAGGEVVLQAPGDGSYGESELGEHRILFVVVPGNLSVELFEFRNERLP